MPEAVPAPQSGDALIVVDVQNDFCPGGALAVPRGDEVVPVLNDWIRRFRTAGLPVAYTQDWHPHDHVSFRAQGGPWPPHCVQGTPGAAFHPALLVDGTVFRKADERDREAYSGFAGHAGVGPNGPSEGLADWLRRHGVRRVFVGGLATDYCVQATVLDALAAGFEVVLIRDAVRAVDVQPGDGERAIAEMQARGARVV